MKFLEGVTSVDPTKIRRLRHRLCEHPLMKIDSLVELAMRHDPQYVRYHDGEREFRTDFGKILTMDPGRASLRRAIDNLGKSRVFVQLIGIDKDPAYRALIDEFFDEVEQALPAADRGLLNRDAAAFIASPHSVTPYHLDHEQNFLCHIQGPKTLHVWDGRDRDIVSERALEIFYGDGTLREVHYRPELESRAQVFELQPGDTVFMPMGSPHAVRTGDGVTVTFSLLMNTRSALREMSNFRANYALRRLGLSPSPVGTAPRREAVKRALHGAYRVASSAVRGRKPQSVRYY